MNVNKEDKISEKKINEIFRLSLIINSFLKTILSK